MYMKIRKIEKNARTFMPEIIAPGTGLSPSTNKGTLQFNNVSDIESILKNDHKYVMPNAGGNWGRGEDLEAHYKPEGDLYKRKERDSEILNKMTQPLVDQTETWKVKIPGGSKIFPSFALVQEFKEKMRQKGVPVKWVTRIAKTQDKVQTVTQSLQKTFKVESIDSYNAIKESGAAFCVAPNVFATCAHVVVKYDKNVETTIDLEDYADRISVFIISNGRKIPAEVIAINSAWDIALLKASIDVPPFELDTTSIQVGDEILTVGSPHGFENNVSFGNVGSLGRHIYGHQGAAQYMFVDAPVFQGNSGGPIVKVDSGEVVGMLTSIVAQNGDYGLNVGLPSYYLQNFCIMNKVTTK